MIYIYISEDAIIFRLNVKTKKINALNYNFFLRLIVKFLTKVYDEKCAFAPYYVTKIITGYIIFAERKSAICV